MSTHPYTPNTGRGWRYVHLTRSDLDRIEAELRRGLPPGGRVLTRTDTALMDQVEDLDLLGIDSLARLVMIRSAPGQVQVRFTVGRLGADVETDPGPDQVAQSVADKVEAILASRYERVPWHIGLWLGLVVISAWVAASALVPRLGIEGWSRLALLGGLVLLVALVTAWPMVLLAPHQVRLAPPLSWYQQRALWALGALVPIAATGIAVLFAVAR